MANDLIMRASYNKRPIHVLSGDRVDPDKLTRELGNIEQALRGPTTLSSAYYNILDYGADPRGARDSSAAIQRAIDALAKNLTSASTAVYGGVVLAPPGRYRLTSPLNITSNGIVLQGMTTGASVFYVDHTGDGVYFRPESPLSVQRSVGLRHLRFESSVTDRTAGSRAVHLDTTLQFDITDVYVQSRQETAIYLEGCLDGVLRECRLDAPVGATAFSYGVLMEPGAVSGPNQITLDNCWIENAIEAGVRVVGNGSFSTNLVTLRETLIQGCQGDGLQFSRSIDLRLIGCWFEANGRDATSGRGHIIDTSVGTSTMNKLLQVEGCVLGSSDTAHATGFFWMQVANASGIKVTGTYFSTGARLDIHPTATWGLRMVGNWCASGSPTFDAISNDRVMQDNYVADTNVLWSGAARATSADGPDATAADLDATPSVGPKVSMLYLNNSGATSITNLDDSFVGQTVTLVAANGNTTIVHGGNFRLAGSVNFAMVANETLTVRREGILGPRWLEVGRLVL